MNVVVRLAHRGDAPTLAALQREAAIVGYRDIFPEEAEPPTLEELLAQWHLWLDPDRQQGRTARAFETQRFGHRGSCRWRREERHIGHARAVRRPEWYRAWKLGHRRGRRSPGHTALGGCVPRLMSARSRTCGIGANATFQASS